MVDHAIYHLVMKSTRSRKSNFSGRKDSKKRDSDSDDSRSSNQSDKGSLAFQSSEHSIPNLLKHQNSIMTGNKDEYEEEKKTDSIQSLTKISSEFSSYQDLNHPRKFFEHSDTGGRTAFKMYKVQRDEMSEESKANSLTESAPVSNSTSELGSINLKDKKPQFLFKNSFDSDVSLKRPKLESIQTNQSTSDLNSMSSVGTSEVKSPHPIRLIRQSSIGLRLQNIKSPRNAKDSEGKYVRRRVQRLSTTVESTHQLSKFSQREGLQRNSSLKYDSREVVFIPCVDQEKEEENKKPKRRKSTDAKKKKKTENKRPEGTRKRTRKLYIQTQKPKNRPRCADPDNEGLNTPELEPCEENYLAQGSLSDSQVNYTSINEPE